MVGLILSIPIEILLYKASKDEELSEKKRYIAKLGFNFYIFVFATNMPRSTQYYKMRKELLELLNISGNRGRK